MYIKRFNLCLIRRFSISNPTCSWDHYSVLGIERTATTKEIKAAFYELSNKYHPDRNPGNKKDASAKFQAIVDAYEVLGNKERRLEYDSRFISPPIGGANFPKPDYSSLRERMRHRDYNVSTKYAQNTLSRELYRNSAYANSMTRWHEAGKDTPRESILKDHDFKMNWEVVKKIGALFGVAIIAIGYFSSEPGPNFHDERPANYKYRR